MCKEKRLEQDFQRDMLRLYEILEGYEKGKFSAREIFGEIYRRAREFGDLNAFITLNDGEV